MRSPRSGRWVEGLGLCPGIAVLPHHENRDPAEVSESLKGALPEGIDVLGIDAQSCCLLKEERWEVLGEVGLRFTGRAIGIDTAPGDFFPASPAG